MSRRNGLCGAIVAVVMLAASAARAVEPGEMLPDATAEARARALSAELRCLVCQNQSIDESDAELARDLRKIVRQRIVAGDSNDEIKKFLVARFGDFVLLSPPVNQHTWLLWSLPFLALGVGAVAAFGRSRRAVGEAVTELDSDEQMRLDRILKDNG